MKTRVLITILALFLTLLMAFESHATGKGSYKRAFRKDFVGTWVNSEYNKDQHALYAKLVIKSDSLVMAYLTVSSEWPSEGTIRIDERWTDAQGYTYYKVYVVLTGGFVSYELWRINDAKDTLEKNWYSGSYPDEINPKSGYYYIYYRQE